MQASDLTALLAKLPRTRTSVIIAPSPACIAGKPVGPFKYFDSQGRPQRCRAVRTSPRPAVDCVCFAWLGHDDSRAINTLDMLVEDGGTPYTTI